MYRYLLIFSGCLLAGFSLRAQQLKLGSNPTVIDKTALLELESSNQGLLLPRISDTNAFHPNPIPNGMLIYYVGTSDSCLMIRKDGAWVKIVDFVNLSAHETDPIATTRTVSVTAGNPAISVTGNPTQALGNNPSFTLSVPNTSPIWNADSLQSVKISTTLPTANQFLNFDGSQWTPVSFDTGYVPNFSQKVRNLFSAGTGINYNATTGVISSTDWHLTGNIGTTPGTNFLGTIDNQDLVFKTSNTERMRITTAGNVGIGTQNPAANLDVNGTFKLGQQGTKLNNVIKISNFPITDNQSFSWNTTRILNVSLATVLPAGFSLSPGATIIMNPRSDLPAGLAVGWVRVNNINNNTTIRIGLINTGGGTNGSNSLGTVNFDITIIQ